MDDQVIIPNGFVYKKWCLIFLLMIGFIIPAMGFILFLLTLDVNKLVIFNEFSGYRNWFFGNVQGDASFILAN